MEAITIKMKERMLKEIDSKLKNNRYSTRTEFIRDDIRSKLSQIQKEELKEYFRKNLGVLKGKAKMDDEERAGELAVRSIAKKLNVKLD